MEFFLTAVRETSDEVVSAARRLLTVFDQDRRKVETLGRAAASALRVFQFAQTSPMLTIASAAANTSSTFPTAAASVEHLVRLGILEEITGRQRNRLFVYRQHVSILSEGTEPLPLR